MLFTAWRADPGNPPPDTRDLKPRTCVEAEMGPRGMVLPFSTVPGKSSGEELLMETHGYHGVGLRLQGDITFIHR